MTALADLARAEWAARVAADKAAADNAAAGALRALRDAAQSAVTAVMRKRDGSALSWADTGLRIREADPARQRAVVTDGTVNLLIRRQDDGSWVVHWASWDGGPAWVQGERIRAVSDIAPHLPPPTATPPTGPVTPVVPVKP